MAYARSPNTDFERYLRIIVGLNEDDIQLISKEYNDKFNTYELSPGIYTIEDIAEAVYKKGDHEGALQIECDNVTRETKPILTRFASTFGALRLDKNSVFGTLLGFEPYWDYKPTNAFHADSPGVYASDKILKIKTIDKLRLNCDVLDGSVV